MSNKYGPCSCCGCLINNKKCTKNSYNLISGSLNVEENNINLLSYFLYPEKEYGFSSIPDVYYTDIPNTTIEYDSNFLYEDLNNYCIFRFLSQGIFKTLVNFTFSEQTGVVYNAFLIPETLFNSFNESYLSVYYIYEDEFNNCKVTLSNFRKLETIYYCDVNIKYIKNSTIIYENNILCVLFDSETTGGYGENNEIKEGTNGKQYIPVYLYSSVFYNEFEEKYNFSIYFSKINGYPDLDLNYFTSYPINYPINNQTFYEYYYYFNETKHQAVARDGQYYTKYYDVFTIEKSIYRTKICIESYSDNSINSDEIPVGIDNRFMMSPTYFLRHGLKSSNLYDDKNTFFPVYQDPETLNYLSEVCYYGIGGFDGYHREVENDS